MPILAPDTLDFTSNSLEQTIRLGVRLGELLQAGDVICLAGNLGAGKTAFASGVGKGWGARELVNSPTFVIAHEHRRERDATRLYHLDCYRLTGLEDAETIGIEDMLAGDAVVLIEWPERIVPLLPDERLWISLAEADVPTRRQLQFRASGSRCQTLLEAFRRDAFGG